MKFDVLVVGGGVMGLTTALMLSKRFSSVAIIDAGALTINTQRKGGRVFALNHASERLLREAGVWPVLQKIGISPYRRMVVADAVTDAMIEFDARMVAHETLGHIVHESSLKNALLECLSVFDNVALYPQESVSEIEESDAGIRLTTTNFEFEASICVIAEGALSTTRQLLQVPMTTWPYHQHALVTTVCTEKSHEMTASQMFTPEGPLAFLPLSDPHQCSIVWSASPQFIRHVVSLSAFKRDALLSEAFKGQFGGVECIDELITYPLHMRHAQRYVGRHWVLMGDAAHTIHPLAGLGFNLGLGDLNAFLRWTANYSMKRALMGYQRERKTEITKMIALMEGLKALFLNPLPPIQWLRGFGLRQCQSSTILKQFFIEQASR